VRYNCRWQLAP